MASQNHSPQGTPGLNTPLVTTVGIVSALCVITLVVAMQAWFRYEKDQLTARRIVDQPVHELVAWNHEQAAQLTGGRWVDEQAGIKTIPIEQAMKLVVEQAR